MSDNSGIAWTDATWNPTTGCDRVSPGCANCYALTLAARLKAMGAPAYQRDGDPRTSGPGFALTLHPDRLDQPLRWTRPRRIFVNSMSDLFHPDVPDEFIDEVFAVMAKCDGRAGRSHTFQVLTKRPERMRDYLTDPETPWRIGGAICNQTVGFRPLLREPDEKGHRGLDTWAEPMPLPNVWLGTSVENQRWADERIPLLLATPATVRFISAEPLLGPVGLKPVYRLDGQVVDPVELESLAGVVVDYPALEGIDWVIIGGESGPGHRPMNVTWAVDLAAVADMAGTKVFMKQDSGPKSGKQGRIPAALWSRKEYPR